MNTNNKTFGARKNITLKDLNKIPHKTIIGATQPIEFRPVNPNNVKLVADDILKVVWPDANEEEKITFNSLLLAVFKSIRSDVFKFLVEQTPGNCDDRARLDYSAYIKIEEDVGCDSPLPVKRINHRYKYYELQYDRRVFIQNYIWDYKDLDEDVAVFIKNREKYKMYKKDFDLIKQKGIECTICHQLCVTSVNHACTFCSEYDRLLFFIKICKFFKVLGSMYLFYWFLSDETFDYICKHADKFSKVFQKSFSFPIMEKYAVYENIQDIFFHTEDDEPKKNQQMELEEVNDKDDKAITLMDAVSKKYEEEKKMKKEKEKERIKKLIELRRKRERTKDATDDKQKKIPQQDVKKHKYYKLVSVKYAAKLQSKANETPKGDEELEHLGLIKNLLKEDNKPKPLESMGDKSLI